MAKKIARDELEKLVHIVANHPDGIGIEELLTLLGDTTPKRTVQYRLANLVQAGTLKITGLGRNSKYCEVLENGEVSQSDTHSRSSTIPLCPQAQRVKKLISTPVELRPSVGYRREFLDSYVPNESFYLSESILNRLAKLGAGSEKESPAGTYARKIYPRLLIDLSWNSSRLQRNSYSLLETERLLSTGEETPGRDSTDAQMILNHKEAIAFIVDMAQEVNINSYSILNIHGLLSHDLLLDPRACGRLRTIPVKSDNSAYHPLEDPQSIEECFQLIIQKASAIENPFEQSFFLMVHLPYLQPFLDVNTRVSRLVGNIPFIRENLSPLSFVDVPESDYIQGLLAIYELNRIELFRDLFIWAYERSASLYLATLEAIGDPDPFRIQYRDLIRCAVCDIVQQNMNKIEGSQAIQKLARESVPSADQSRFIEIVEIEVSSLHEGNFARFRLRPHEFFEWQKGWK